MMSFKRIIEFLKKLKFRYQDDEVSALAAQLAYYLVLAFFPFLILVLTLISYSPASGTEFIEGLELILPHSVHVLVENNVLAIANSNKGELLSLGLITAIWLASRGVGAVIRGLNKAYDEQEQRPFWVVKGEAILFTIAFVVVIILTFLLLIFGEHVGSIIINWFGQSTYINDIWNSLRYGIMLSMMILVFAALYYFAPDRKLTCREVMPGAIITTFGWLLTSLVFAYYVDNYARYSEIYGTIGGTIVLLIWLYISAIVILMGGEINATLAFDREGKEKPKGKKY